MAAFPSLSLHVETIVSIRDSIVIDVFEGGEASARNPQSEGVPNDFNLVMILTDTDLATLDAFYDANLAEEFTLTFEGVAKTCVFGGSPQKQKIRGGSPDGLWRVTVPVHETTYVIVGNRITEASENRITEAGEQRIIE